MKWMRILALSGAALLVACSGTPYQTDYDYRQDANFSDYRTFSWISEKALIVTSNQVLNPLFEDRLKRATRNALELRGFTFTDDPEKADLVLSFTIGARDQIKVTSYPEPYRGNYGWGGRYYGGYHGGTSTDVRQYTQGTLAVDVFDVKMREPVWHGKATAVMRDRTREEKDALLEQLMKDMFAEFPPV